MKKLSDSQRIPMFNQLILRDMIGEVTIVPGPADSCSVEIEVQDNLSAHFKFGVKDTRYVVQGPKAKNVSTNNDVTTLYFDSSPAVVVISLPKIKITVPREVLVDFAGRGLGRLTANGLNSAFRVKTNGQFELSLEGTSDLDIETNGAALSTLKNVNGKLEVNSNGSGSIEASGRFLDVDISINGTGNGNITGDCDDCDLSVNGMGMITYTGHVRGDLSKSANPSFMCQVITNLK